MKPEKVLLNMSCILFFLLCGMLLTGNPAVAADYTVCESGCDHATIQAAIDDAFDDVPSGGTVTVTDSRTYAENISMKNGVDLVAETGQTPSIEAMPLPFLTGGVVVFTGPIACNLTGEFTVKATNMGAAIFVDGSSGQVSAIIDGCTATGTNYGVAIRLKDAVSVTINDCYVHNGGMGAPRLGIGNSAWGSIHDRLASGSSVTIKGTTVGGPGGQGLAASGIRLRGDDGTSNIWVTIGGSGVSNRNIISYNTEAGIVLSNIDKASIENNEISNHYQAGILLIDVDTVDPHIKNNDIHDNGADMGAGINIGGASQVTIGDDAATIGGDNKIYRNQTGIAFYVEENNVFGGMDPLTGTASSQLVKITGNDIYSNTIAGIAVIDNVTGTITIDNNKIHQNSQSGIAFFNACTAVITANEVEGHNVAAGIFTGDWSGTFGLHAGTGFYRDNGPANLTIERNKVYNNRAGMRLDHASGTITNNLVYGNSRGGIRFSGNSAGSAPFPVDFDPWGITEVKNNTVDHNGAGVRGGGIVYDDINAAHTNFFDSPVGAPQGPITIKNNIVTNNMKAGIRACFDNTGEERDYNLVYSNNGTGETDCGWPDSINMKCANKNFGGCGGKWNLPGPPKILPDGPNNNIADPMFVDVTPGSEDYRLQAGSPAIDAGDPAAGYDDIEDPGNPGYALSPSQGTVRNDMGAYGGPNPLPYP